MSALTLLDELVTSQAFWGILGLAAFAGLLYHTTEILKTWHAQDAEDEQEPTPDTCASTMKNSRPARTSTPPC